MKIEIWSDVSCPYCYMGKRQFEDALAQFKDRDSLEIDWKSFELAPDLKTQPEKNMNQFLAELKGISVEQAASLGNQVANSAKQFGLDYYFDKAIPTNTFNAHRLAHFAKEYQLQDQAKEALFKAYFTEGKNVDAIPTLITLGEEIGLDGAELRSVLESDRFADRVRQDIAEARQLGINSVPSFVFNGTVAVKGVQGSTAFLEALEKAFKNWRLNNPVSQQLDAEASSCTIGESC